MKNELTRSLDEIPRFGWVRDVKYGDLLHLVSLERAYDMRKYSVRLGEIFSALRYEFERRKYEKEIYDAMDAARQALSGEGDP